MSKEHSNPPFTLTVLQRMVAVLREVGADVISLDDLEQAINQMGEKNGAHRNRH